MMSRSSACRAAKLLQELAEDGYQLRAGVLSLAQDQQFRDGPYGA